MTMLHLHVTESSPRAEYLPAIKARLQSRICLRGDGHGYRCTYCNAAVYKALPAVCECGKTLYKLVAEMTAAELFLAARMNGLRLNLTWAPIDGAAPAGDNP
jgi:hypothetical protein